MEGGTKVDAGWDDVGQHLHGVWRGWVAKRPTSIACGHANRSGVAYRGRAAAEASARRCPLHVDVLVEARLAVAEPAAALIRESEGAALIVVGSRAHGVARATFLRSVSRSVVQRARCPVVVVRTGRATGDEKVQPSRRTAVDLVDPSAAKPVRRRRTPWE